MEWGSSWGKNGGLTYLNERQLLPGAAVRDVDDNDRRNARVTHRSTLARA